MEKTIEWIKTSETTGVSRMVDQLLIPYEYKKVDIKTSDDIYDAIKTMIVRGAPAIGIAGAHGVCLGAIEALDKDDFIYPNKVRNMQQQLKIITDYLGYKNIGTHSFRKLFAHTLYEESGHDIELVRHVLNHSDIKTTMRYLGVSMKKLKEMSSKIDFSYAL